MCMSPRSAALKVEQPGGLYRIADATRQGVEPLIIEVHHSTREGTASDCAASIVAGEIKQFADTNHKSAAKLVIAANLTATGKTGTVSGDFSAGSTRTGIAKRPRCCRRCSTRSRSAPSLRPHQALHRAYRQH